MRKGLCASQTIRVEGTGGRPDGIYYVDALEAKLVPADKKNALTYQQTVRGAFTHRGLFVVSQLIPLPR